MVRCSKYCAIAALIKIDFPIGSEYNTISDIEIFVCHLNLMTLGRSRPVFLSAGTDCLGL